MEGEGTTEGRRGFLQNDKLLVCSMFAFYGFCIIGMIAGAAVWLGKRNAAISAEATSTAQAVATEKASVTATAVAHRTEQAQYDFIDRFDNNIKDWRSGKEDNEYWTGSINISKGNYKWDVVEVKDTFVSWADFPAYELIRDFDVYVDTKIIDTSPGDVCSGFQFRVPGSWDYGGYYFALCSNGSVRISYHTKEDGWERMATRHYPSYSNDWNRLEIVARESHFIFYINGEPVHEMDDDRGKAGKLALIIEFNEKVPAMVLFDNLGLQRR